MARAVSGCGTPGAMAPLSSPYRGLTLMANNLEVIYKADFKYMISDIKQIEYMA